MKTYYNKIGDKMYWYFYDTSTKFWTVYQVNNLGCQIGYADYYANKKQLLASYKFDFKNVL